MCDGGIQATVTTTENDLKVESPLVPFGETWTKDLGRYSLYERVPVVVEAYCYRSGQESGYVKASFELQISEPAKVSVSPPVIEEVERDLYCRAGPDTWLEAVEPVPCISGLVRTTP